jgi:hypothetical protein
MVLLLGVGAGGIGPSAGVERCNEIWWEKLNVLKSYQYLVTVLASIS